VNASATLREFADTFRSQHPYAAYPVNENSELVGVVSLRALNRVPAEKWDQTRVSEIADRRAPRVSADSDLMDAMRLLTSQRGQDLVLVTNGGGKLEGVLTRSDLLTTLNVRDAVTANPPA